MGGRGSSSTGNGNGSGTRLSARQALRRSSQKRDEIRKENLTDPQFRDRLGVEFEKVSGATQQQFDFLKNFAQSKGWKIKEQDTILGRSTVNGLAKYREREIILNSNRTLSQKTKSLAHEIYHMNKHRPGKAGHKATREGKEMEAETFAQMVTQRFKMNNNSSQLYVEGWRRRGGLDSIYLNRGRPQQDLLDTYNQMFPDSSQ